MNPLAVFLIAIGLSMDAFAVSLAGCMTWEGHRYRNALKLGIFFGGFQALMPVLGYLGGVHLADYVRSIDHWVAFLLLLFVGGKMIVQALKSESAECKRECLTYKTLLVLSVATSIDAFAVGLTFAFLEVSILKPAIIIGLTTFTISAVGALLGDRLGRLSGNKIEIAGGLILVGIGSKILFDHLSL